jgi:hypothetical protein
MTFGCALAGFLAVPISGRLNLSKRTVIVIITYLKLKMMILLKLRLQVAGLRSQVSEKPTGNKTDLRLALEAGIILDQQWRPPRGIVPASGIFGNHGRSGGSRVALIV